MDDAGRQDLEVIAEYLQNVVYDNDDSIFYDGNQSVIYLFLTLNFDENSPLLAKLLQRNKKKQIFAVEAFLNPSKNKEISEWVILNSRDKSQIESAITSLVKRDSLGIDHLLLVEKHQELNFPISKAYIEYINHLINTDDYVLDFCCKINPSLLMVNEESVSKIVSLCLLKGIDPVLLSAHSNKARLRFNPQYFSTNFNELFNKDEKLRDIHCDNILKALLSTTISRDSKFAEVFKSMVWKTDQFTLNNFEKSLLSNSSLIRSLKNTKLANEIINLISSELD